MKQSLEQIIKPEKIGITNVWLINSRTKINEEISNILAESKERITLIIPKIEDHLRIEQLQSLKPGVQIRLVASDHHVNTLVKSFKEINNLTYKKLENENILALKGDNNHIVIALVKKDSKSPIDDVVGHL